LRLFTSTHPDSPRKNPIYRAVPSLNISTPFTLNGTAHHVVYGRIPARQHLLKAGSFSSALTVTVSYDL